MNLALAEDKELDILTLCAACTGALAEAVERLKDDTVRNRVNERLRDIGLEYKGMIKVEKKNTGEFLVIMDEKNSKTEYNVKLDDDYYQKLTRSKISKQELIEKSFQFLLERESKESILSRFNLKIIKSYFPGYEKEIKKDL